MRLREFDFDIPLNLMTEELLPVQLTFGTVEKIASSFIPFLAVVTSAFYSPSNIGLIHMFSPTHQ